MKHAANLPSRGASSSPHRLSHAIVRASPRKIRIVHVLPPEVIKTEPRDFRKLVQRLTGKPSQKGSCAASVPIGEDASPSLSPWQPTSVSSYDTADDESLGAAAGIKMKALKVESGGYNDGFYLQGVEDFLSSCDTDGVAGFKF